MDNGNPIIYEYDSIGCQSNSENFAVGGNAATGMMGLLENLYRPDLTPQQLEDNLAEILVAGTDRNILAGYGGIVYTLTTSDMMVANLKTKMV